MKNREIYAQDPTKQKLVNQGVVRLGAREPEVLRCELESFVCKGEYEKGMVHILENYLKYVDKPKQSAVWVSGFYGSGKSHFVKMLSSLWENKAFEDGARPRGLAQIPDSVSQKFKELDVLSERFNCPPLAVSGVPASSERGNIQMAVLQIVFASVGLPTQYAAACFALWLKKEGLWDTIRQKVERSGRNWQRELEEFRVSGVLHQALVEARPGTFAETGECARILCAQFELKEKISSGDMLEEMKRALTLGANQDDGLPLTLVVLDELQQHIGEDSDRSADVQEMVEVCCSKTKGRLLFVGTGQTAISGTSNLKKLEGRFLVRVTLSDNDVDTVVRQVVLAKQLKAKESIQRIMDSNLGEITRHLRGTAIAHRQEDEEVFVQDYPILPVRRRFWQEAWRALDKSGTDSQLRNQLSMVHRLVCENADRPLGCVPPADCLYFEAAERLLQSKVLPREVYDKTMAGYEAGEDEKLVARACGLVFLINQMAVNEELNIHATVDTLADLLVEDLAQGSGSLRSRLPELLKDCELLMMVGDTRFGEVYRIKTVKYSEWERRFEGARSALSSTPGQVDAKRNECVVAKFKSLVSSLRFNQGKAKVPRNVQYMFTGADEGSKKNRKEVCVLLIDGLSGGSEREALDRARQAGSNSAEVFIYLPKPKHSRDRLRQAMMDSHAAGTTLQEFGQRVLCAEEKEARMAMETKKRNADNVVDEVLDELFDKARGFQSGGGELQNDSLRTKLSSAIEAALKRLYPEFSIADHDAWSKVHERARKGSPDALTIVGYEGKVSEHRLCQALLKFIADGSAQGKRGAEIRSHFELPPFGWPRDAIDAGLTVLLCGERISARNEVGKVVVVQGLDRKVLPKTTFKSERVVVSVQDRIAIRGLFQTVDLLDVEPGKELAATDNFLEKMRQLAQRAGGDPPKPEIPSPSLLEDIYSQPGNERLLLIRGHQPELEKLIECWKRSAASIEKRLPQWQRLEKLLGHVKPTGHIKGDGSTAVTGWEGFLQKGELILQHRQLLEEPDPVSGLERELAQKLREKLNQFVADYEGGLQTGRKDLDADAGWVRVPQAEREQILLKFQLGVSETPRVSLEGAEEVLKTLNNYPLRSFSDKLDAIPTRFSKVMEEVAKYNEPRSQFVSLSPCTFRSENEIDVWAEDVKSKLKLALEKGPVVIYTGKSRS